ncbi:MAG: DUF58 domain-containing protein [Desulfotignum sp.]|nr:DUF58 domain-containing protein [Desulfotignum sp.]MCF8087842.1 DUF58 domain-containing protein [Desulfotignum sp.]MCF8137607.1 DUF58 domain-containing protein [Desulfotignum sp.]
MMIHKKHLSIRPTRHGLLFLIILGAMMAGSINYNNNAGFILVFLLGGMALISLFYSLKNLIGLSLFFVSASPVFAGRTARFFFQVQANGMERAGVTLTLPDQADILETSLLKHETKTVHLPLKTAARGVFTPGPLTVSSVFPFGFFCLTTRMSLPMNCLVYPSPADGPVRPVRGGGHLDGTAASRFSGPDDFQGLALYQPGHDVGRIAWKAVSRGQGVFVKDFTAGTGGFMMLDFDAIASNDTEFKLSRLCRMVVSADRNKTPYGLKLPDRLIPPAQGPGHKHQCLRALALYGKKDSLS